MLNHDNRKIFQISFSFIFYSVLDGVFLSGLYSVFHNFSIDGIFLSRLSSIIHNLSIHSNFVLATIFVSRLSARCWNFFERLNFPDNQTKKAIYPRFYNHFSSLIKYSIMILPLWWITSVITPEKLSDLVLILFCAITEVILIGIETYRLNDITKHLHNNWIEINFVKLMIDFQEFKKDTFIVVNGCLLLFLILCTLFDPFLGFIWIVAAFPYVIIIIMAIDYLIMSEFFYLDLEFKKDTFIVVNGCLLIFLILCTLINPLLGMIWIGTAFPYIIIMMMLIDYFMTPEVCYLDLDNQKIISQQFIAFGNKLNRKNRKFSQFKHSFQDISEIEILTHKQALQEYTKYLKYCYEANNQPWKLLTERNFSGVDLDFYHVCIKLSLEENEFYLPLTQICYENTSKLNKIVHQLELIIFK